MRCFLVLCLILVAGCTLDKPSYRWNHIVVVVMENRNVSQVRDLPYLSGLVAQGREYPNSYGVARPSQPNYLALFSGSTHGVTDNAVHDLSADNLSTRLRAAGLRFATYAQGLPSVGFRGDADPYRRKHNPAASFTNVPDQEILPFTAFPNDYNSLPEVAFIIPDLDHDMHDGPVEESESSGDKWLETELGPYADWAAAHDSLLIVTFDEPSTSASLSTPIFTAFRGQGLVPSTDLQPINHYTVLKFLLDSFHLPPLGLDAQESWLFTEN